MIPENYIRTLYDCFNKLQVARFNTATTCNDYL